MQGFFGGWIQLPANELREVESFAIDAALDQSDTDLSG
jgi:hypothetical protein